MVAVVATGLLPLVIALVAAGILGAHRRARFGATVRRRHPEWLVSDCDPRRDLGVVAARSVDLHTPPAPRVVAGDLEVV